ncbi:MAG: ChbG/HpnK family deacetylase [Gammaproteobacteria bacterium]|nr:ChbG/HpnK family deacetylase [Gammaproteobacteria bacterium]
MKKFTLCADDYGQNGAVSQAIIQLLERERLSAVSCMVTQPDWQVAAGELKRFQDRAEFGLHFNLTEGEPLSSALKQSHGFMSLPKLLLRAQFRYLNADAIQAELEAQIDAFSQAMGHLPHFIDGHQHIHQFPVIRDALLAVYESRLQGSQCYLRCTAESYQDCLRGPGRFKRIILQWSGAQAFKKALQARRIPHNTSFSGVYDFAKAAYYASFFPFFLRSISDGGLILCHPGLAAASKSDPLYDARHYELNYLASEQFVRDCQSQEVNLHEGSR